MFWLIPDCQSSKLKSIYFSRVASRRGKNSRKFSCGDFVEIRFFSVASRLSKKILVWKRFHDEMRLGKKKNSFELRALSFRFGEISIVNPSEVV